MTARSLFATCLPGLEPLLADELRALGATPRPASGTVHFAGDVRLLLSACLRLGTAAQVLVQLAQFQCRSLAELERQVASLPWRDWLRADAPLDVDAKARKSKLFHTGAIEERVRKGVAAALGMPVAAALAAATSETEGDERAQLAVRFFDDRCTIALADAATPLHRRGYRLQTGKAPLREDLAFALLMASGWQPGEALLDPFCGSGTIAIEAAAMARGLPPGRLRPAPLQPTALFDAQLWKEVQAAAVRPAVASPIAASDRDAGAIEATKANAERAGVGDAIDAQCCAVAAQPWFADPAKAPTSGVLVTNPPFGHRVAQGNQLLPLYQTLGHRLLRLGDGWRATILAHDLRLARRTGIPLKVAFVTRHGGLGVTALCREAVAKVDAAPV